MSEIKALDKLRKLTICDKGEEYTAYLDAGNIVDEIEVEISKCYMPLPVDTDGAPIRVGDKLECHANGYDGAFTVFAVGNNVVVGDHDIEWIGRNPSKWFHVASFCTHVKPRTLEDVLRGVVTLCANTWKDEKSAFRYYDVDNVMDCGNIADFADEIRAMFGEVDHGIA